MLIAGAWIAWAICALVALKWLWGHVELSRAVRALLLRPAPPAGPPDGLRVSVILAAHNEAAGIRACLERIAAQSRPAAEIIVANDRSTDGTGTLVRELARGDPRIRCLDIAALPPGWIGKTHALACAADQAGGDLLVFTDADVVWHPDLLATLADLMARERLDFASLWPKVLAVGFWERLLLPACGWVLSLWFHPRRPGRIEDTPAFANGQLLAVRRAVYDEIGGHAAVRDDLAEDVALARRAQAAGRRRFLGLGRELLTTRMYESLPQIVAGWMRIYAGALRARWRVAASLAAIALGVWAPLVVLAVLAGRAAGGTWAAAESAWLAVAAVHLAAMYALLRRELALGLEGRVHVLLLPLALVGVAVLLVRCVLLMSGVGTLGWGGVRFRVRGPRIVAGGGGAAQPASASSSIRSA